MRNIKLIIEYDGTDFCGWQVQTKNKDKESIQKVIQGALKIILKETVKLTGSGRTDSGVHARGQVANFKTGSDISLKKLQASLNGILPRQIRIKKAANVPLDFNARFDATSKLYRYTILNNTCGSPFYERFAYFIPRALDLKKMKIASGYFLGRHNFNNFCVKDKTKEGSKVRNIKKISIRKTGELINIDVAANGFLHNMVRRIAGVLIQAGLKKMSPYDVKKSLHTKGNLPVKWTAPSLGLCLMKVDYS